MAADDLAKKREEFEDTQLEALNIQSDLDSEAVLQQAKNIGLITDKVLEDIKESGVKDKLATSFKAAKDKAEKGLAIEPDLSKRRAKAFRIAFRSVYGRFMMEEPPLSSPANVSIIDRLKKVLKFEIDEHGIKARPELRAATSRLNSYLRGKWPSMKPVRIAAAEAEKATLQAKKQSIDSHLNGMTAFTSITESLLSAMPEYSDIYSKVQGSDALKVGIPGMEGDLEFLDTLIAIKGISSSEIISFFSVLPGPRMSDSDASKSDLLSQNLLSLSEDKLNLLVAKIQNNQFFARRVLGIAEKEDLEKKDVELAVRRMKQVFDTSNFNDSPGYTDQQLKNSKVMYKMIEAASGNLSKALETDSLKPLTEDLFVMREKFSDAIPNAKDKSATLASDLRDGRQKNQKKLVNISDIFDRMETSIVEIKNDPAMSAEVKDLCAKFLTDYNSWIQNNSGMSPDEIKDFMKNKVNVFSEKLKTLLAADSRTAGDGLASLDSKIVGLNNDIIPATEAEDILSKAFPKRKSGAEMKRLERLHHEAEHKEHELQDVYKYFSSHDSFTNVVEGGSQLDAAIKDWRDEQVKSVEAIEAGLSKLGPDDNDERAKLEKQKNKAGLPLNARIAYLEEQIALKKQSTLSNEAIEKTLNERAKRNDKDFKREDERERMEKDNERKAEELGVLKDEHKRLTLIASKAKEFRDELTKLVIKAVKAEHLGIDIKSHVGSSETTHSNDKHGGEHHGHHGIAAEISGLLQKMNLDNGNFDPQNLVDLYGKFNGLFADGDRVQKLLEDFDAASAEKSKATKDAKKELDKETANAEKEKNFTDADAAKRIIGALVWEQFPKLTPMEHNKLVTMILAEDVATLQTDEGYEALAQRGSAENLKVVGAAFRAKLISFKFKEGEKVTQPFKGLKPSDFENWASIEKLFLRGKLNYKNAFFVLAAFEDFDNGVKSIQAVQLEKKLKKLLAKELGVDEHMDKAGLSKIVDDAFKAQMEKVRPLMKAHNDLVQDKGGEAKSNKKKVLDMRYEELNDQLRTKKIGREIYENKLKALVKEATEADVEVEFSVDSTAAQFWNSPQAQWLRDKAHDTGVLIGKKTLAAAVFAPAKILGKGAWGATKLGASLGFQGALLPVRAAKYPLLLAAKPLVGLVNLFRSNKWTPLPGIRASLNNDVGRVMGYAKEKATGTVKGAAETVTKTTSAEWDKVKYTDTRYEDRRKHHADERAELLKLHEPKSELDAIDVAESPFISFDKYRKQVDMVATALGIKINAPSGHEVKVGHEEPAKKEEPAHATPAHGAESKKDEPAHGADAHAHHEEPKKAAGGHH